jgi:7,8-dihydro-6-hydroxymethylpterin dimethyltransferase
MQKIYNRTQALCGTCGDKVDAAIIEKDDAVFLEKYCPAHGTTLALVSSSAAWYRDSLSFVKPMTKPLSRSVNEFSGCPDSCGLCPEHGQHTCLPVVEIMSGCDFACPICLKTWESDRLMTPDQFRSIVDRLLSCEGFVPLINLSGGEPTLHPALFELLSIAREKSILQVSISTNGNRLLRDADFRKRLREYDPLIALQFDGFDGPAVRELRGADLVADKLALVEILEREGFKYSLVATVVREVNDGDIPKIVDLFFTSKALSLMFQPAAFTGRAAERRDPLRRLTIPDVIAGIDKSAFAKAKDFVPLPCSHPTCFALSYYLQADDGSAAPLKEILGLEPYLGVISNRTLPGLDIEGFTALRHRIYDLWSAADQFPNGEAILKKIRSLLKELNERGFSPEAAFDLGSRSVKAIFIHQFMDRDSLDFGRLVKCCNHYPQVDGRLIPMCAQNVFFS